MTDLTLQALARNVQRRSVFGETYDERQIQEWLKDVAIRAAAVIGFPKDTYTATAVDGQAEYLLPANFQKAEAVLYNNRRLERIDWEGWSGATGDGQNTEPGIPQYYLIWGDKLHIIGDLSDTKTIKMHYWKRPTRHLRTVKGAVGASPTTTTVVLAAIATQLGHVDNLDTASTFFNDCIVEFTSGNASGEKARVTSYDDSSSTLTFTPACTLSTAADGVILHDVLEMPQEFVHVAEDYATAMVLGASPDISDRNAATWWRDQYEKGFYQMKLYGGRRHRDPRGSRVKTPDVWYRRAF